MALGDYQSWYDFKAFPGVTAQFLADIRKIIDASGVVLAGPDGLGEPILSEGKVLFNGSAEKGEEATDFKLTGVGLQSVHTLSKPYDKVVKAVLLRGMTYFPDFVIEENEDKKGMGFDINWAEGVNLYESLFGEWEMTYTRDTDPAWESARERYEFEAEKDKAQEEAESARLAAELKTYEENHDLSDIPGLKAGAGRMEIAPGIVVEMSPGVGVMSGDDFFDLVKDGLLDNLPSCSDDEDYDDEDEDER